MNSTCLGEDSQLVKARTCLGGCSLRVKPNTDRGRHTWQAGCLGLPWGREVVARRSLGL